MVPIGIVAAVVVAALGFFGLYRPWHLKWGAAPEDLARSMPLGTEPLPSSSRSRRASRPLPQTEPVLPALCKSDPRIVHKTRNHAIVINRGGNGIHLVHAVM